MKRAKGPLGAAALGAAFFSLVLSATAQTANWRSTVADHLNQRDIMGAVRFLEDAAAGLEADERPEAAGLLAYLNDRLGNKTQARAWLFQFFETYGGPNLSLPYLGIVNEAEVLGYINSWRSRFPGVALVSFFWNKKNPGPMPPETLALGVEMTNDAYFRFSGEDGLTTGGLLHKGFNILTISSAAFFDRSGAHVFWLNLKAGDILLKKEITISVNMTPEPGPTPEQKLSTTRSMIYALSFYVGDQLILRSQKTELAANPLKLDIKPVNLKANPLFKPPGSNDIWDPSSHGVSITQAIGVISGLIKDAFKKKPQTAESTYQKLGVLGLSFFRPGPSNEETEVKATLSLQVRGLPAGT
jgi:hypothetical protein